MNLKRTMGREKNIDPDELNITPVMNIFLILVPFLMLTAVFVKISILEFSLPGADQAKSDSQVPLPVVTILSITDKGFELKSKDFKIPLIEKEKEVFDFEALVEKLVEVKAKYQGSEDIIIAPQATIKYDIIIKVMDSCRENGFPNISISG